MKKFVMDLGRSLVAVGANGERIDIPRFALWAVRREFRDGVPARSSKPVVVAVSPSLEELLKEHGEDLPVFYLDELAAK